jgi:predicted house-cleaning noncanonical NTP pyrophosphatase (MazG superfamily)
MGTRLVRDGALRSWTVPGAEHQVRPVANIEEHRVLLKQKLLEEVGEVIFATNRDELLKELADLLAVMESVASVSGLDWEQVLLKTDARQLQSGGFTKGLVWETPR